MLISGVALFVAFASSAYANGYFRLKLILLLVAALNAVIFHRATQRNATLWDAAARPPASVRFAGLASLVAWAGVILAGRMMSYTMF